ncbi:MAG: hypothetical protein JJE22_12630, partial [Bacteroidia bacterium]|nr:hypothetical protein [Bacteroidia bacterium]
VVILIQSIMDRQWFGIILGIYFASMGLFAIGCAGGYCYGINHNYEPNKKTDESIRDVGFEEVK